MTTESDQEALDKLAGELIEKFKVSVGSLHVMFLATGEQIIGSTGVAIPGKVATVSNPKRIIRIQQMHGPGIAISLMIGDLDLIEEGTIDMIPQLSYRVMSQSPSSAMAILGLYREHMERRTEARAMESGIVVPNKSLLTSPFAKK